MNLGPVVGFNILFFTEAVVIILIIILVVLIISAVSENTDHQSKIKN